MFWDMVIAPLLGFFVFLFIGIAITESARKTREKEELKKAQAKEEYLNRLKNH